MTDKEIEIIVDMEIKKGFESSTRGWIMTKILNIFHDPLDRKYAREYIIKDVCSIQETSY
jgi:nicotinamide riboside kinase